MKTRWFAAAIATFALALSPALAQPQGEEDSAPVAAPTDGKKASPAKKVKGKVGNTKRKQKGPKLLNVDKPAKSEKSDKKGAKSGLKDLRTKDKKAGAKGKDVKKKGKDDKVPVELKETVKRADSDAPAKPTDPNREKN